MVNLFQGKTNSRQFQYVSLFLFFLPFALFAQNNTSLFDSYMKAQTDLYGFNGNVLVSKNGKIIYKKSFGYADYNTKKELNDNSVFDCGSIAKEFTAMGILLLKDKGRSAIPIRFENSFPSFLMQMLPFSNYLPIPRACPMDLN